MHKIFFFSYITNMKLNQKTWKKISPIIIFLLSAILHSIYELFPNFITALFFPVNESIWEHNKIIIESFLIWMLLDKLFYKKKSSITSNAIAALTCSILVMTIFSFVFFIILNKKDNMIVTFIIYFICIWISQLLNFYLQKKDKVNKYNTIGIILWIIIISLNAYLTYYPLKTGIFYDYKNNNYGIKISSTE